MLFKTTPLAGQHLSFPSSIPSLNCLTELKMYPLLHEERVFVCFFPGQMEDFLPPWEREREAEGGGVVWSCQTTSDPRLPWRTNAPAARGSYPAGREHPAAKKSERRLCHRGEERSQHVWSLFNTNTNTPKAPNSATSLGGDNLGRFSSVWASGAHLHLNNSGQMKEGIPHFSLDYFHYQLIRGLFFPLIN